MLSGNKAATWEPYGCHQPGVPAPRGLTHFAEEEIKAQGIFKFFKVFVKLNKVAILEKSLTKVLEHVEIRSLGAGALHPLTCKMHLSAPVEHS